MKNKLEKQILLIVILTLFFSGILNVFMKVATDNLIDSKFSVIYKQYDVEHNELVFRATERSRDLKFRATIAINLIITLISGFVFWAFIRRETKYINSLSNTLLEMGSGNLDIKASVKGDNELTELAKNINEMSVTFKERLEIEQNLFEKEKDFLTGISHDIRTPLATIIGYQHMIIDGHYRDNKEKEAFNKLSLDKAYELKELLDSILETQEQSIDNIKLISKEDFIGNTMDIIKHQLIEKDYLIITIDDYINYNVECSPSIKRIVDNLISNIEKYAIKEKIIEGKTYFKNGYVNLSITNYANKDDLQEVTKFKQKFFRADKSREEISGYGLGLSICETIAIANGGTLVISAEDNKYTVTLKLKGIEID